MGRLLVLCAVIISCVCAGASGAQDLTKALLRGNLYYYEVPAQFVEEPFFEKWLRFGKRQLNRFDDASSQLLLRIPIEVLSQQTSAELDRERYPQGTTFVLIFADKDYGAIRDDVSRVVLENLRSRSHVELKEDARYYRIYNDGEADFYLADFDPITKESITDEDIVAHCLNIGKVEVFSASCRYSFIYDGMAIEMTIREAELSKVWHYRSAMHALMNNWRGRLPN